jgi:hypothetical protein
MNFTKDNLLITAKEQTAITAALANTTETDPITTAVNQAVTQVEAYTARWAVPDAWLKKLVRALALHDLYAQFQEVPKNRADAYAQAMQELKDIRDGKFEMLDEAEPQPGTLATSLGSSGGNTRKTMRTDSTST